MRGLAEWWEYLDWGPFYFVRRLWCRLRGHDWTTDDSTPEQTMFCAHCMTEDT